MSRDGARLHVPGRRVSRRVDLSAFAWEVLVSSKAAHTTESHSNKWVVLFTVVAMTFMSTLDSSIVNIALPVMQRELAATPAGIQWVSTVYLLACCATVLIFGRLGDTLGKVRLFQAGVALFTVGSALCGLSTTLPALIAARAVQGIGAASAMANNMGIVTEAFPVDQRGRALGIVSTFVSLGMMCGPTIGGVLVAAFPWESIFLINVPIGTVAFAVGMRTLPREAARGARGHLDVAGAALVVPAILLLFCSLTFMAQGVVPLLVGMFIAGVALFVAFIAVERRAAEPLIQLDTFRNIPFSVNLITMLICFSAVGGTEYLLPFFLQDACGFPSSVAGLALTAIPLGMAVVGPLSGALSDRIGSALPCGIGLAIYAAGISFTGSLPATASLALIVGGMLVMAVGMGLFQSPNNSLVMGSVGREHLGFAGSMVSLVRYLGMSMGVTGGTALLYGHTSALAGHPVATFAEGGAELFAQGFAFTFYVFGALSILGVVLTVIAARVGK